MTSGWVAKVDVNCPVCGRVAHVPRVLYSRLRVLERDTDFYTRYEGCEPSYYSAVVCQHCSYAAPEASFSELDHRDATQFRAMVGDRTLSVDLTGERDRDRAILCTRLALFWTDRRRFGSRWGLTGALYLRLAWIHRYHGHAEPEQDAMHRATFAYKKCFEEEDVLPGKMTTGHLKYLIGELLLRSGEPREATGWFQLALQDEAMPKEPLLVRRVRDRFQSARDLLLDAADGKV